MEEILLVLRELSRNLERILGENGAKAAVRQGAKQAGREITQREELRTPEDVISHFKDLWGEERDYRFEPYNEDEYKITVCQCPLLQFESEVMCLIYDGIQEGALEEATGKETHWDKTRGWQTNEDKCKGILQIK